MPSSETLVDSILRTTYPARSAPAARRESRCLAATRLLAGTHALAGLALVLFAFYALVATGDDAPSDGARLLGCVVGAIGLPLLVLAAVSALSHGPRWAHGFGLATAAWVVAVAVDVAAGGPASVATDASGSLPAGVWLPVVTLPPVLLVTAGAGLVLRRRR